MEKQEYPKFEGETKEITENNRIFQLSENLKEPLDKKTGIELLSEIKLLRNELEEYRNEISTKKS